MNFDQCRLCLRFSFGLSSIFDLQTEILETTSIQITETDYFSKKVCSECSTSIKNFYNFREICLKNQQKLVEIKIEVQPFDDNNEENNTFFDDTDDESDVTEVSNQIFIKEVRSLYVPPKETSKSLEKSSQDVEVSKPPKPKKKKALPKKTPRELYLEKMYPCTMCAKMVVQNRMEGHINKHNGLRPFVCNTDGCVKDFFCPVVMSLHKQYSHGPFKFPCKICNKSFGTKVTLKIHSFCHNDRNIQCDLCGKKSKSKKALKKHMVSHSGIRNFQCKMCHQSFYTNHNLNAHERIHTKERPYKCPICPDKAFGYNRLMKDHIIKMHPEFDLQQFLNTISENKKKVPR